MAEVAALLEGWKSLDDVKFQDVILRQLFSLDVSQVVGLRA